MKRRSDRMKLNQDMLEKIKDVEEKVSKIKERMHSNVIDLFKNVRYYYSGILGEKVSQTLEVGQAKLCPYLSSFCDYYIVGINPDNKEIEEAISLNIAAVSQDWVVGSAKAGKLLPATAFSVSPSQGQLLSGVRVCISGVSRPDACAIWAMVKFNGGQVDTLLNEATTHLVATGEGGRLYKEALGRNDVFAVTPDWVSNSVRLEIKCIENLYHPRLLLNNGSKSTDTSRLVPMDEVSRDRDTKAVSKAGLGMKSRHNVAWWSRFTKSPGSKSPSRSGEAKKKNEDKAEEKTRTKEKGLKIKPFLGGLKSLLPRRRGRPKGSVKGNVSIDKNRNKIEVQQVECWREDQQKILTPPIQKQMRNRPSQLIMSLNQTVKDNTANSPRMSTSPDPMSESTMKGREDCLSTTRGEISSSSKTRKRKPIDEENVDTVSKKMKREKTSNSFESSEMSNSTGDTFCQICDKTFARRFNLMLHVKTIHEGIRIPCAMCDYTASTKSNLRKHVVTKHNVPKDTRSGLHKNIPMVDNSQDGVTEDHINVSSLTSTPALNREREQNRDHGTPPLSTIKCHPNPIFKSSSQFKSSNSAQKHVVVGNRPQGKDLRQQECSSTQPSKLHTAAAHPAPSLSQPTVQDLHAMLPLPKSNQGNASVPASLDDTKEASLGVGSWTVEQTIAQLSLLDPNLAPHIQMFRSHEIDGKALLLLTPEMMMAYLNMKLGPALKLANIILKLESK